MTADYAHPPHERTFIAQYSADEVLAVSMFVAQALSQECVVQIGYWLLHPLKAALPARNAAPVCVDVARVRVDGTKRDLEGLRVSGTDGERVVDAVKALLTGEPRPQKPA